MNDPELKQTQTGKSVCNFRIAVNDRRDAPVFFSCVAWDKTAEFITKYFKKGSSILVQGRMNQRSYEGKDGGSRTVYEINVTDAFFAGSKAEAGAGAPGGDAPQKTVEFEPVDLNEDLPF